jgi:hypothetical protein
MDEVTEQAEVEMPETAVQETVESPESVSDIFSKALTDKAGSPEDSSQTEEGQTQEQPKKADDKAAIETPYGEIVVTEGQKAVFKNEKEYRDFLERNPFLKKSAMVYEDYIRKTQQVAQERKKFEEERKKFEEEKQLDSTGWGKTKPTKEDLQVFQNAWTVFQHGSDALAGKIQAFYHDVSLISQGKSPVGPLANKDGSAVDYRADSQVIGVKREFDQYRQEQERKEAEREAKNAEREASEAKAQIDTWLSEKEKAGIKIEPDEFAAMARVSKMAHAAGENITLDEMHRLALAQLGKTEKLAIKKVFTETKKRSSQTPVKPASRIPSGAKPVAQSLDEIFQEGQEQLAQ